MCTQKKIKGHESFQIVEEEKLNAIIEEATIKYGEFLTAMGYDWQNDPNMSDTPKRVTKAYVKELMSGNFLPMPKVTSFQDDEDPELIYDGIVLQKNIEIKSLCSHHFLPFTGVCHIAYMPGVDGSVIGLSKLNRIADWCARRPQVQERLTQQIQKQLDFLIPNNQGIAVLIEAKHQCCSNRGIGHDSTMSTMVVTGVFRDNNSVKQELMFLLNKK